MKILTMSRDRHLLPNSGIEFANDGAYVSLDAAEQQSYNVPEGTQIVQISITPGSQVLCDVQPITYAPTNAFQSWSFQSLLQGEYRVVNPGNILYFHAINSSIITLACYIGNY